MASGIYDIFKRELMKKNIDLVNDTVQVALMTSSFSFDPDVATNTVWSDVSANEITGVNYVAGGATLSGKAVTESDVSDKGIFSASDVTWAAATITAYYAVLYDVTASDYLIAAIDFGGAITSTAGDFKITWNAGGIITLS